MLADLLKAESIYIATGLTDMDKLIVDKRHLSNTESIDKFLLSRDFLLETCKN